MERDSLFGDRVVWSGRPKVVATSPLFRAAAWILAVVSVSTTLSAVAAASILNAPAGPMLLVAAWLAFLAVAAWRLPIWWRSELRYLVTDRSIIVQRGRYRRFIDRKSVSFARIHWHAEQRDVGDLELVRAVPAGVLRRPMRIVLHGLVAPDRVWAYIRGIAPATPLGDGERPLAQRLDEGERVLWSAHPTTDWRRMLPVTPRDGLSIVLALGLGASAVATGVGASRGVLAAIRGGLEPGSFSLIMLVMSVVLSIALLASASGWIAYRTLILPLKLDLETRYLITDRRVLIQRGLEELHLERDRIAFVIDSPGPGNTHDLFLVLDGPKARGLAISGGFGDMSDPGLQPVLMLIDDAEAAQQILAGKVDDAVLRPA